MIEEDKDSALLKNITNNKDNINKNKVSSKASSNSFIHKVLAKTAMHFFGPTANPELPRKNEIININHFLTSLHDFNQDDVNFIKKAFVFADKSHLGQYRQSGEPYITHPLAVAEICVAWKLGKFAICAAFLHDVMEDQDVGKNELIAEFGIEVADLVEGLTKLTNSEFNSKEDERAANFDRLLASSIKDHKVLLVKIADRLHNMRTLKYMKSTKQRIIAKETQEIYAPLAKRLGLHQAYNELQDLSFLYYYPWRYEILRKALDTQYESANDFIEKVCNNININLAKYNILATCQGYIKTPFIIYNKLRSKKQSYKGFRLKDMQDLLSFEIIVGQKIDCYTAMGVLHSIFKPKPGRFKDYISLPKRNGYRGLHTNLIDNHGYAFGVQIRTKRMQKIAESGIVAAFDDKEISENNLDNSKPDELLNSLQELRNQANDFNELLHYSKIDLSSDEIVVFDVNGNPVLVPRYSTALDFAYHISYMVGNKTKSIEINGAKCSFNQPLKNGDLVKIKTSENVIVHKDWLKIVKTSRAKIAIQHYLRTNN